MGAGADGWQATRVVAIRHGQTEWNVGGRIQGQLDIPLDAHGRWQADRLAAALAGEGIEAVWSSDLQRALETARALAGPLGLTVTLDAALRERAFGVFEGLTYQEIAERWPADAERWRRRDPSFGAAGGETLAEFSDRCVAAVERIAAAEAGRTVAIVAHGGVMDCLYRAASRIALDAPRSWQLGNTSINRLLHTPQGFTLVGWSDTQHLDGAEPEAAADTGPGAGAASAARS